MSLKNRTLAKRINHQSLINFQFSSGPLILFTASVTAPAVPGDSSFGNRRFGVVPGFTMWHSENIHLQNREVFVFIAMNRFRIARGRESDFEGIWRNRNSYLKEVP